MNRYQTYLIEDPPPKNPYFTLPDIEHFLLPEDIKKDEQSKPSHTSLVDLFGAFDKMSDDQQTKFLLNLMKHSNFMPDYAAMAEAFNIASSNHVKRRFVAIADHQGFQVEGDTIKVDDTVESPPAKMAKKATKTTAPKRASGRKHKLVERATKRQSTARTNIAGDSSTNLDHSNNTIVVRTQASYLDDDGADVEDNVA